MKKETKYGVFGFFLVLVVAGGLFSLVYFGVFGEPEAPAVTTTVVTTQPIVSSPGLVYTDLTGNLMDKGKFATDQSNDYAGINGSLKIYDITANPQNDPRTNINAVPDFQIVATATGTTAGALSATTKGIAGHTYVYYFENTTGSFYDVTGTFTIPANINPYEPSFDFGNILAPYVGTLTTWNESGLETDGSGVIHHNLSVQSTTKSTDLQVKVGSQTYGEFVRIWGEWESASDKNSIVGVSVLQKSGPTTGVSIDSSDERNPIITINELTAQYPITFTYYFQGSSSVGTTWYMIYVDDWNGVPGKFGTKIDAPVGLT